MSTAAQLARRKIATPKGRLNANRPSQSTSLGSGSTNTFGKPTSQPTFSNLNGGITFGGSQSFPQDTSSTNSGFNFQPPQSSTFNFGAPSSTPNPFASVNGTGGGMNTQQQDVSMESPQKKPAFGTAFGSNNTSTSNNMGSAFTFGQPAQQQANGSFAFGTAQNGTASTGGAGAGLFGRVSKPEDSQTSSNPFGQPSNTQPTFGGFGQAASTPQSAPSSFTFGQNTSTAAVSTSAPSFGFGQSTTVPQSPLPAFGGGQGNGTHATTEPPKFAFGQTPTTLQGQASGTTFTGSGSATTSSSNIFGAGNNANGQAPKTAFASSTTSPPFSFGQNQPAPTQSNPFGGFGVPKSAEPNSTTSSFGNSASIQQPAAEPEQRSASPTKSFAPTSSDSSAKAPSNPFSNLFAGSDTPPIAPVSKPSFGFGATSQPAETSSTTTASSESPAPKATFTFGATTPAPPSSESSATTQTTPGPKPSFGFGSTSQTSSASNSGEADFAPATKSPFSIGATGQQSAQSAGASEGKASETNSSSVFFGSKSESSTDHVEAQNASTAGQSVGQADQNNAQFEGTSSSARPALFGFPAQSKPASSGGLFSPVKDAAAGVGNQQQGSASNLFSTVPKTGPTSSNKRTEPAATQASSTPTLFGIGKQSETQDALTAQKATPSKPSNETPKLFQSSSNNQSQVTGHGLDQSASAASEPVKRPVYTKAPPFIPSHLDAERYREYDRNYRLHSLNAGLKRKLEDLDPRSYDFDNIIRHYVAARDSIGASLGLYTRNVAGTKRKGDRLDVDDEEPLQNKRTRSNNDQQGPSKSQPTPVFGAGITPQKSAFGPSSTSNTASQDAGSSNTTARLGGMIPEADPSSAAERPQPDGQTLNPFSLPPRSTTPPPSTTPTNSPPKKPTFEVPKFGGGNNNFMNAFGQKAKENAEKFEQSLIEKRKAEDFDSDEDDEETFRKQAEEEMRAKRAKIEAVSKGGFTPNFGVRDTSASTPLPFGAENKSPSKPSFDFGSMSGGAQKPESSKSGFSGFTKTASANPFAAFNYAETSGDHSQQGDDEEDEDSDDSNKSTKYGDEGGDEDGSESSNGSEEQGESDHQNGENIEDTDEDEDGDDNDFQAALDRSRRNANAGKSLFDRIEPNPSKPADTITNGEQKESAADSNPILQSAKNSSFPPAVWGSHIGKSTPEAPTFSPITPATGAATSAFKPPKASFNFTPTAPNTTSTPTPGASIFAGGLTKGGPVPGEGLFGSRPSTPSNAEKNGSLAKSILTSPAGTDNTWKAGAPISFANGEKNQTAPTFQFTAASPGDKDSSAPKPFGSLFGTASTEPKATETPNQVGFQFGVPASNPAPGFLGAISHLGGGSVTSSAGSSRATSPGVTDNESVATNETDETPEDPQATSLMESRAGEENESCIWEGRSKALMFVNPETAQGTKLKVNDWNSMGVGQMRVLKNKDTGKTRVVFRVEPNANILINSHLIEGVTYEKAESSKSGAVKGALIYKGNLVRWVFKVKTPEMAADLAKSMEENKNAGA
ncbi:hypothetical protein A1O1_07126 [Capronia coronata CBS 617.96]|uniref:RanBD1 domain-containing protein n=1 Tax=Capronia coronata CBS 617.96 TaxID=1182541 RepID=W9XTF8_9EURO|nr:uncharacterized protein A1O1_07126 [Capronia coronata CBS 617.96]EXJ83503.1 hypothetical protein A1O1_07126 [Capronia coronata CBS 617.96]